MVTDNSLDITVDFNKLGLMPRSFKYGGRKYEIKKINLMHSITDGAVRIYFYSVSDDTNFWKLGFNTETLSWWVEDRYSANDGI